MLFNRWIKKRKIGLALGGGAALGAAHVGVIRALQEQGVRISFITGNSIGAFVATLYSFGIGWEKMAEIANEMHWFDVSRISLTRYSLLSNKKIGDIIRKYTGDVSFDQAPIPLAVVAADISNGKKVIISEGNVAEAVMASTAIPGVFKPVEIGGKMLADGGIVENVPVSPLIDMGAGYIIAVNLNAKRNFSKPRHILDVMINSYYTVILHLAAAYTREADLEIVPDLAGFSLVDTHRAEELIEKGYEEAMRMLSKGL